MFEQTFVDTRVQPRKPAAMAASIVLQTAAVGGLLLIPLLHRIASTAETGKPRDLDDSYKAGAASAGARNCRAEKAAPAATRCAHRPDPHTHKDSGLR